MKKMLVLFFVLCCVFCGTDGQCEYEGKTYERRDRYFTHDCKQKCTCRKRGVFVCVPLCKKTTLPNCSHTYIKTVPVKTTNCTCSVVKCATTNNGKLKPTNEPPLLQQTTSPKQSSDASGLNQTTKTEDGESEQLKLYHIIIIVVMAVILVIIVTIVLWRCSTKNPCSRKESNDAEEGQQRRWSTIPNNRPLPTIPSDHTNDQKNSNTTHTKNATPPSLKAPPRVRGVPNPYLTDSSLHTPHVEAQRNSQKSNAPHYQELEEATDTSNNDACEAYETPESLYTDLTDIREDCYDLPNIPVVEEDYLQPLPSI